jgi:hypothetical protein
MAHKGRLKFAVAVATALAMLVAAVWYWTRGPRLALEISLQGVKTRDFHFSPDGQTLAVVTYRDPEEEPGRGTRIYRVSDGKLLHELAGGGLRCAWNWDGSLFAVARDNWPDIEIWDARTWTLSNRLMLLEPAKGRPKSEAAIRSLFCSGPCFDRPGNLYVVEWNEHFARDRKVLPDGIPRATVWWNGGKNRREIDADFGVSAASSGDETRLVCSDKVKILRIGKTQNGSGTIGREYYEVPEIGGLSSVSVTADGKYLAARDSEKCYLFQLFDDHAKLIDSWKDRGGLLPILPGTDVSLDGRFAAYMSRAV